MAKLQLFIKKQAETTFGKHPSERTITELLQYGIINLDKPKGPTSHQTADYVKKIIHTTKAGHSGTLDPQVSGVQPVAIGKATRIAEFLLTAPKEYICLMHIHKEFDLDKFNTVITKFIGKIKQLPPLKSSVKRQLREREIYELEILEIKKQDVLFRVKCQAGTYIRKLCDDIGKELGIGAHMAELRRTQAGPFTEKDNLVTLNDLLDAHHYYTTENNPKYLLHCIQPIENALKYLPKCWIFDTTINSVTHGRDVGIPGISKLENFRKGETVAIMTLNDELVAMGEALMSGVEINTKQKGLAIKTKKVFMDPQEKTI
ncbi:TPA: RNA-guided pseudouridylation complex pseudouridine synthase subunit Cbf5 [Candidatus Woesearchaeota archaeon]|nr:RNA-guided pseudouridylation complex pseudouridine synthase subunit Cbf5 [Candidatus Woesearchaeota archaeon]